METLIMNELIPVTVLTSFLGAGNHVTHSDGKPRPQIAAIKNEFSEEGSTMICWVESTQQGW